MVGLHLSLPKHAYKSAPMEHLLITILINVCKYARMGSMVI